MKTIFTYNLASSDETVMKVPHCRHHQAAGEKQSCIAVEKRVSEAPAADKGKPGRIISLDTLGIIASSLCLVHCLAVPVVLLAVPTIAAEIFASDLTHVVLAGAVTAFCLLAIVPGYCRHNSKSVLGLMLLGLSLVLVATFCLQFLGQERLEMPVISLGNILVVFAHVRNKSLLQAYNA